MVCGDGCPHGDPNCTCLDQQQATSGWQPAVLMVQSGSSSMNTYTGGTWNTPPTSVPVLPANSPTIQIWPQPMTGVELTPTEDECAQGHYIDEKTIRFVKVDDEDEILGRCLFCDCEIFIPRVVGGLSFEKAGAAVGRAMTLHDGDNEKIGELMADLAQLERDTHAEIERYKRALGMIEIARDLARQRAIEGLAEVAA